MLIQRELKDELGGSFFIVNSNRIVNASLLAPTAAQNAAVCVAANLFVILFVMYDHQEVYSSSEAVGGHDPNDSQARSWHSDARTMPFARTWPLAPQQFCSSWRTCAS